METLGNILHSMGATVGLVSPAEKKEEKKEEAHVPFSAPTASEGAAPASIDYEPKQSGGILSSIANAARAALVPPPLDADPVAETVEPIRPVESAKPVEKKVEEAKEEAKPTFLGNLLHKVEAKIEDAIPLVAPHADDKKAEVQVSALGPVWEEEKSMTPIVAKATELLAKNSPAELKAGSWETEGGSVRKEEKKELTPAAVKRESIGVSDASLVRVAKVADRVMAQNAEDRVVAEEKKEEVKAAPIVAEAKAAPIVAEAKAASPKETELPRGAEEKTEAETVGETAAPAPAPAIAIAPPSLSAVQQMSVNTIIRTVIEPVANIDESKLPPLTADIAFAPASIHGPTHHEYHPKHTHGAHRVVVHQLNQPQA